MAINNDLGQISKSYARGGYASEGGGVLSMLDCVRQ